MELAIGLSSQKRPVQRSNSEDDHLSEAQVNSLTPFAAKLEYIEVNLVFSIPSTAAPRIISTRCQARHDHISASLMQRLLSASVSDGMLNLLFKEENGNELSFLVNGLFQLLPDSPESLAGGAQ